MITACNYGKSSTDLAQIPFPPHKALMPEQNCEGLEQQTVPQFMLMVYNNLQESEDVLKKIGVHSASGSQLACLVELPLPSIFNCLQLFANWIRDGMYDFAALPLGVKTNLSSQDQQLIQQVSHKWTGREGKKRRGKGRKEGKRREGEKVEGGKGGLHGSPVTKISYFNRNTGSHGDLLEEIKQMIEVLKHSETHILKTANESAHVRVTALLP